MVERLDFSRPPPGFTGRIGLGRLVSIWTAYKARHAPPGLTCSIAPGDGQVVVDTRARWTLAVAPLMPEALALAWSWYERRLALHRAIEQATHADPDKPEESAWPECLTWSDEECERRSAVLEGEVRHG